LSESAAAAAALLRRAVVAVFLALGLMVFTDLRRLAAPAAAGDLGSAAILLPPVECMIVSQSVRSDAMQPVYEVNNRLINRL
jgi:hypothetical protein